MDAILDNLQLIDAVNAASTRLAYTEDTAPEPDPFWLEQQQANEKIVSDAAAEGNPIPPDRDHRNRPALGWPKVLSKFEFPGSDSAAGAAADAARLRELAAEAADPGRLMAQRKLRIKIAELRRLRSRLRPSRIHQTVLATMATSTDASSHRVYGGVLGKIEALSNAAAAICRGDTQQVANGMNDRAIAAVELAELIVDVAAEVGAAQNFEVDDLFAKLDGRKLPALGGCAAAIFPGGSAPGNALATDADEAADEAGVQTSKVEENAKAKLGQIRATAPLRLGASATSKIAACCAALVSQLAPAAAAPIAGVAQQPAAASLPLPEASSLTIAIMATAILLTMVNLASAMLQWKALPGDSDGQKNWTLEEVMVGEAAPDVEVTCKRACLIAIGHHHVTLQSMIAQHRIVQARADMLNGITVADDKANVAHAAQLELAVAACEAALARSLRRYTDDGLVEVALPDRPAPPPTATDFDGWQAIAADELSHLQLQIGIAVTSSDDDASTTAAAVKRFNERRDILFAAIAPSVTSTTDRYDQAQTAALANARDQKAMDQIMALSGSTPSEKALQPAADVGQSGTVAGAVTDLLSAAAVAGPGIHAALGMMLAAYDYRAGPNKKSERSFDKVWQKYLAKGGARALTDVVRGAVICETFHEMLRALKVVYSSPNFEVLRGKFSVDPAKPATDSGGYRDVQLLVREVGGSGHVFELQFVLSSMYEIKGVEGHKIYRAARAVGAYEPANFEHRGELTDDVVNKVGAGLLRAVAVASRDVDGALLDRFWAALAGPTCRVRSLGLGGLRLTGDVQTNKLVAALEAHPGNFADLDLGGNSFTPALLCPVVVKLLSLTTLKSLDLFNTELGPDGSKAISEALKGNITITHITIQSTSLGAEGVKAISEALKVNKSVTDITLVNSNLGPDGGVAIAEALKVNKTVTTVNLRGNDLGPVGGKAVADALKVNRTVSNIDLSNNELGSEGGKAIAGAVRINRVVAGINLAWNKLGPDAAKAIGEALKVNKTLASIKLHNNELSSEGGRSISEALRVNGTVTYINLLDNNFDRATEDAITAAWGSRAGELELVVAMGMDFFAPMGPPAGPMGPPVGPVGPPIGPVGPPIGPMGPPIGPMGPPIGPMGPP